MITRMIRTLPLCVLSTALNCADSIIIPNREEVYLLVLRLTLKLMLTFSAFNDIIEWKAGDCILRCGGVECVMHKELQKSDLYARTIERQAHFCCAGNRIETEECEKEQTISSYVTSNSLFSVGDYSTVKEIYKQQHICGKMIITVYHW